MHAELELEAGVVLVIGSALSCPKLEGMLNVKLLDGTQAELQRGRGWSLEGRSWLLEGWSRAARGQNPIVDIVH